MNLTASDIYGYYQPAVCARRIYLRHVGEPEAEPGPYEQILFRFGKRHETDHLVSLGEVEDLSSVDFREAVQRTKDLIRRGARVIYQPVFTAEAKLGSVRRIIGGAPDFIIRKGNSHLIRDCKISSQQLAQLDEDYLSEVKRPWGTREQRVGKKAGFIVRQALALAKNRELIIGKLKLPTARNIAIFDKRGCRRNWMKLKKSIYGASRFLAKGPVILCPPYLGSAKMATGRNGLNSSAIARIFLPPTGIYPWYTGRHMRGEG